MEPREDLTKKKKKKECALHSVSQRLPVPLLLQPAGGFLRANTSYFATVREGSNVFIQLKICVYVISAATNVTFNKRLYGNCYSRFRKSRSHLAPPSRAFLVAITVQSLLRRQKC
jgi:hypothetical protein